MRLAAIHNGAKMEIYASGGLWLLQMVSELDTERRANKDAGPDCKIPHLLERGLVKVETSP